jgi:hypothetical protein
MLDLLCCGGGAGMGFHCNGAPLGRYSSRVDYVYVCTPTGNEPDSIIMLEGHLEYLLDHGHESWGHPRQPALSGIQEPLSA